MKSFGQQSTCHAWASHQVQLVCCLALVVRNSFRFRGLVLSKAVWREQQEKGSKVETTLEIHNWRNFRSELWVNVQSCELCLLLKYLRICRYPESQTAGQCHVSHSHSMYHRLLVVFSSQTCLWSFYVLLKLDTKSCDTQRFCCWFVTSMQESSTNAATPFLTHVPAVFRKPVRACWISNSMLLFLSFLVMLLASSVMFLSSFGFFVFFALLLFFVFFFFFFWEEGEISQSFSTSQLIFRCLSSLSN